MYFLIPNFGSLLDSLVTLVSIGIIQIAILVLHGRSSQYPKNTCFWVFGGSTVQNKYRNLDDAYASFS